MMGIFQKSVINKHLANLDSGQVEKAYQKFNENYNSTKIEEIKKLKEEQYQDGFLRDIFVDVFGYVLAPDENHNLAREFKNIADSKKADGAILKDGKAVAVIELKSTKTKDLKSVTEQAFGYKHNQPDCKYVIISNFQKLQFYIDYANEYEEFDLFNLQKEEFELLYLLLNAESIFSDLPLRLKTETKFHEENVSNKLYKDYSVFKRKLFENLIKNNPDFDKLTLFKKSQKLLDRFLFILFAEDSGLLPPNSITRIIEKYNLLIELDEYKAIYEIYKQYFGYMNIGRKGKTEADKIPAYNGGLFYPDALLDNLIIDDKILISDLLKLSEYDFNTEVDVNILGHIFEHSLNEIEEITAEIAATAATRGHVPLALSTASKANQVAPLATTSKRKKDGVFYTPKYITQYIVENTVGTLCTEKRKEFEISEIEVDESYYRKRGKSKNPRGHVPFSEKGKKLFETLEKYKEWLLTLKIVDPACGSGAFLNQALNFLIAEHKSIDDIIAELTNTPLRLFDTEKSILENNLYGVDINEESVEIAKLSLWLRTARKDRKLSNLNNNIKCGNSLIDDPEVAGDKAFNWNEEFPQIYKKKEKQAWHITTATHNSRYSQRMFDYHVKVGEAIWIDEKDAIIITEAIAEIIKEDNLNVIEYNICGDHMHMLLVCEEEEVSKIVGKIKGKSSLIFHRRVGITTTRGRVPLSGSDDASSSVLLDGEASVPLWTQKFGNSRVKDEEYLLNAIRYIRNNRKKHELPENKELEKIIDGMICTTEHAFRTEYNGGFDVVIGNPPYGAKISKSHFNYYNFLYETSHYKLDTFSLFIEKSIKLAKQKGQIGLIVPYTWLTIQQHSKLRKFVLSYKLLQIIDLPTKIFADADLDTVISIIRKEKNCKNIRIGIIKNNEIVLVNELSFNNINKTQNLLININLSDFDHDVLDKIQSNSSKLDDCFEVSQGLIPYDKYRGHTSEQIKNRVFHSAKKENETYKKELKGGDISRYTAGWNGNLWISYGDWLAAPRKIKYFKSPRILIMEVTRGNKYVLKSCYVEKEFYNTPSIINIISNSNNNESLKYLLATINSSLFSWYHKKINPKANAKTSIPKILVNDVRDLPYKNISQENQQPFIEKANKMLELNKQFRQKKNEFLSRVKDNFSTRGRVPLALKVTKKLDAFYNFDFKIFIAELKKQKVAISLTEQVEWEEFFNSYKTELNNLQSEINETDKEIDQMVYELYGLSEEEIGIVEGSDRNGK